MNLFRRKFSVKFLNNLLAQVTPFIFYTLGGYYALKGELDIGQLVAVIAAYRDLPGPIKELIDWDQQRADVIIKFEQVVGAFTRDLTPPEAECSNEVPSASDPILISGLAVTDSRNIVQLERLSLVIERPSHIALVGPQGSARDIVPKVIGRQLTHYNGNVSLGGKPLERISDESASRSMIYVGPDPFIMPGTIRDNICLSTRRQIPTPLGEDSGQPYEDKQRDEADRTGNPVHSAEQDWTDYSRLGISGPAELDRQIIAALLTIRGYGRVFQAGMEGKVGDQITPEIEQRFISARASIRAKLAERNLAKLVEPFDHRLFNNSATIGENLLFGIAVGHRFSSANIAKEPFFRSILQAEALLEPLERIGRQIAQSLVDVFGSLPPGSPLYERYSFFDASEREEVARLLADIRGSGSLLVRRAGRQRFLGFALQYVESRHRLNLVDDALQARILRARFSFRSFISSKLSSDIEFYDGEAVIRSAPIRDNLLFGRVGYGIMGAQAKIFDLVNEAIRDNELELFVVQQGLAREAGPAGRLLSPDQRAMIALARAVLVKPDMLILDNALGSFAQEDQQQILAGIRERFQDASLMVTLPDVTSAQGFDRIITFNGTRLATDVSVKQQSPNTVAQDRDLMTMSG